MKTPLEVIADFGASTTSYIAAVHYLRYERTPLTRQQQLQGIADIIGVESVDIGGNDKEIEMMFLYAVQETIRAFQSGIIPDMEAVWVDAQRRYSKFVAEAPWSIKDYSEDDQEAVDENGAPKRKKGAKKQMAEELYQRMNDGANDRLAIIDALIEEVGMTKSGATTYFHNLKKEFGYRGPKVVKQKKTAEPKENKPATQKKPKAAKGPSKGAIAKQIYAEMVGKDKKEIIAAIVAKTGTSPAGANTYYCAAKKSIDNNDD